MLRHVMQHIYNPLLPYLYIVSRDTLFSTFLFVPSASAVDLIFFVEHKLGCLPMLHFASSDRKNSQDAQELG